MATTININDLTPPAPSGRKNILWQHDALNPENVSGFMDVATGAAAGAVILAGDFGGTGTSPTVVSTHLTLPLPVAQGGTGVNNVAANLVFAGPTSGGSATPHFRAISPLDLGTLVFGPSGPSHSVGLVPDPGSVAGSTRFLREDATWQVGVSAFDGSIAVNQVAFGTDVNTISGSSAFTFTGGVLAVTGAVTAASVTTTGNITAAGLLNVGSGSTGFTHPTTASIIFDPLSTYPTYFIHNGTTGTFAIRNDNMLINSHGTINFAAAGLSVDGGGGSPSFWLYTNAPNGVYSGVTAQSAQIDFEGNGMLALTANQGDGKKGEILLNPSTDLITFYGNTSGHASIGVNVVSGTPNTVLLPTSTGSVGQVLQIQAIVAEGSPPTGSYQQTAWVSPSGGTIGGSIAAGQVAVGSGTNTIFGDSGFTYTSSAVAIAGTLYAGALDAAFAAGAPATYSISQALTVNRIGVVNASTGTTNFNAFGVINQDNFAGAGASGFSGANIQAWSNNAGTITINGSIFPETIVGAVIVAQHIGAGNLAGTYNGPVGLLVESNVKTSTIVSNITGIVIDTGTAGTPTIGQVTSLWIAPGADPGATIDTTIGIYIAPLVASATHEWSIYTDGPVPSYFGGPVEIANGTAAAPSLSFANSTTTGIFLESAVGSPAASGIGFTVAGVLAATIQDNGINIPAGHTYQINGTQIAASDLSNGTVGTGAVVLASSLTRVSAIQFVIDGGGAVPLTGVWGQISIPYNCTITGWTLTGNVSGSAVIDVLKSTYAGFPTTASIVDSSAPTLSSVQKNTSSSLAGWTTALLTGDELQINLSSVITCTRLNLTIAITIP